jgi:hypothetical protein
MKMMTEAMKNDFVVKDSGKRQEFEGGMMREPQDDKLRYDLAFDGPLFWAMYGGKYEGLIKAAKDWYDHKGLDKAARVVFELALITDGGLDAIIDRYTILMMRGAIKYSEGNWLKAQGEAELKRFVASFSRHLVKYLRGETDEDHLAAIFFNLNGAEYVLGKLATKGPLAF